MQNWIGKTAIVTGASSGIGARIVKDLAKAGLQVVGLARRTEPIEALAAEASSYSGKIHPMQCDVSKIESIESAFRKISEKFKKSHILINGAGVLRTGATLSKELKHQDILEQVNTNLIGAVACTRKGFELFDSHEEESYIIMVNSTTAITSPNHRAYSQSNIYPATKLALRNLAETMRLDLAFNGNRKTRIASICPGIVSTDMWNQNPGILDEAQTPHLKPKDVSDAVGYLLSLPPNINVTELIIKPTGELY